MINTIGPVWDGNEVWVLVAGGATFAAFPEWYATLFSGFYLPLLLILVALIVRGLAFEYRGKRDDDTWRAPVGPRRSSSAPTCRRSCGASRSPTSSPGSRSTTNKEFTGNLFTLLNPFGLLGGLVTLALFLTHGAMFVALKTDGDIRHRARELCGQARPGRGRRWPWCSWSGRRPSRTGSVPVAGPVRAGRRLAARRRAHGPAGSRGLGLHRHVRDHRARGRRPLRGAVPRRDALARPTPAFSLTTTNAAATAYTLKVMTWVAVIFTPIVLAYQAWTYWVFRRRIADAPHPGPHSGYRLC